MTTIRADLYRRLATVQNCGRYDHQDIMTIGGFMNDAELRAHVERYETANWDVLADDDTAERDAEVAAMEAR